MRLDMRGGVGQHCGHHIAGATPRLAQAEAKRGQNTAQTIIAKSDADLAAEQAEAKRRVEAAQKVAEARALMEGYHAQQEAENARAERDNAGNIVITLAPD
jgi:flotillin